jgi:hypothetical protein
MRLAMQNPPTARIASTTCVVASLMGWMGCASFEDPSTVIDLRVLAVGTAPSEIILTVTNPADLATVLIPEIRLEPLIVDPRGGGRPVWVSLSACANDPLATSPPNSGADLTGYPSGGARTTVGSALCEGAPTEISIASNVDIATNPEIAAALDPAWVANAFTRDVFFGVDGRLHGGFDLGMPVVFQITAQADGEIVRAIKRVTFWANPVRADAQPNRAPEIDRVWAYDRRDEATAEPIPEALQPLIDGRPLSVPADGLWVDPAAGDAEPYVTAVLDRLTGEVIPHEVPHETLWYAFYATAGTFSPLETSSAPAPGVTNPIRVHIESKYHPPHATQTPVIVTIWIVVRDERGGASWVSRTLEVPAAAPSPGTGP